MRKIKKKQPNVFLNFLQHGKKKIFSHVRKKEIFKTDVLQ